jgi:hypothetical protein
VLTTKFESMLEKSESDWMFEMCARLASLCAELACAPADRIVRCDRYEISEEFMQHPWPVSSPVRICSHHYGEDLTWAGRPQSPLNLPWMVWEIYQFWVDEKRVVEQLKKEKAACLIDDADAQWLGARWWRIHANLRSCSPTAVLCRWDASYR